MLQGKFLDFYNTGKSESIFVECYYKDNKKHGSYKEYDEDGNLIIETNNEQNVNMINK